jgi:hypothetical protein
VILRLSAARNRKLPGFAAAFRRQRTYHLIIYKFRPINGQQTKQ